MRNYTKELLEKLWKGFREKIDEKFAKNISDDYGDYDC